MPLIIPGRELPTSYLSYDPIGSMRRKLSDYERRVQLDDIGRAEGILLRHEVKDLLERVRTSLMNECLTQLG